LHASANITRVIKSRRMTQAEHVTCMGEIRNPYSIPIGRSEWDWVLLVRDKHKWRALVNTVMKLRVPKMAGNILTS